MSIGIQWPLVLFTLLAGAGCGLLAATGFARLTVQQGKSTRKISLICTLVLLAIGGLMSVMHLAHPERFMAAVTNLLSFSGIALELIGLALSGLAALVFLAVSSAENRIGEKVLAICSIVIGVLSTFLHGYAYFEVAAQVGWHTIFLAFCYLATSLTAGALLYVAFASAKDVEKGSYMLIAKVAIGLAALALLSAIIYIVTLANLGLLRSDATMLAALAIILELIALALAVYFSFKNTSRWVAVASVLFGLGGGLAIRSLMWIVSTYGLNLIGEATSSRGLYLF